MELIHLSHCVYHCDYHIVIVTKYRKPIFNDGIFSYLDIKLADITQHYPFIRFTTVNHDQDHLHLLVSIPPTMSVGKVVGIVKQNTAREMKKKFPFVKDVYWGTESIWSEGYFVTTVGMNQKMITDYIEHQGKKDSSICNIWLLMSDISTTSHRPITFLSLSTFHMNRNKVFRSRTHAENMAIYLLFRSDYI